MEVEIISMEKIKPSSPTPDHLRNYKLNLLDQFIPAAYAPVVIFFQNHDASARFRVLERLDLLKRSLSETLTRFFPLAGTIKDDVSIDCDDQGACFTTAKVEYILDDFLECPDLKVIAQFLPCGIASTGFGVTNIQANVFGCGGIALGVCISHRVLDGTALSNFFKSWANDARIISPSTNDQKLPLYAPDFSASRLFPADGTWLKDASISMWGSLFKKGEFVTRRFVFSGVSVALLKDGAAGKNGTSCPTRVEAVSGFIWKHAMAASAERFSYKNMPSLLTHLVNLRQRATPNFPQESIGNLVWVATAMCKGEEESLGFPALARDVRKCISGVDGEYVKKLRGEKGSNVMLRRIKEIEEVGSKNLHHIGFSSWCKLGFYDVDFGWGKPVWVSSMDAGGPDFMNLVMLVDTKCGRGIEAWVTMDEQEMAILECNQEFTAFASLDPSPLRIANVV